MAHPAISKTAGVGIALAFVSAVIAASTSVRAEDATGRVKDQDRHPDTNSNAGIHVDSVDNVAATMPAGARVAIIVLADGGYLIQRYLPSGDSVIIMPDQDNGEAASKEALFSGQARLQENISR